MRELVAAHFANAAAAAPQAPARNTSPANYPPSPSIDTYNSHRKIKRPKLGDKKVYRPVRRHTLSRIDETPPQTLRPRSRSLQHSTDFSSTRPILRSRSNISADTSRSVPVCNQSHEVENQIESSSPQYAEPKGYDSASSYEDRPVSMSDLPIMVPLDPSTGAYIAYPEYFRDGGCKFNPSRWKRKRSKKAPSKHNNLYLAFMY
ncbi:uncharacterized protein LOC131841070 [Achroia grisella]|uniref:uncharacterized protein LOC131841070 n=1 Tax=Achroia grisella TaxID=688607 RepID=UPI0027D2E45E|nr:uncharacterized protein LOC131841070 [Achroia grisella]